MNGDPDGHYRRLGVHPHATSAEIAAAFRRQARRLHPDIPGTGNTDSFIALRQAYAILTDPERRAAYDRRSQRSTLDSIEPEDLGVAMAPVIVEPPMRRPRWSDVPVTVWLALAAVIVVCVYQIAARISAPRPEPALVFSYAPSAGPAVESQPSSPSRPPEPLAGIPNHYALPSPAPTTVWRLEGETNRLVPIGQLAPFTPVQALRLFRQPNLIEIRLPDNLTGFVQAARLAMGNQAAAHRAFCSYHSGSAPASGELLGPHLSGSEAISVRNRMQTPAVLKLRQPDGLMAAAIYIGPGDTVRLYGLHGGPYHVEWAFGEVWSRGCNSFAIGTQAWRFVAPVSLAALTPLAIPPDAGSPLQPVELDEATFNRD